MPASDIRAMLVEYNYFDVEHKKEISLSSTVPRRNVFGGDRGQYVLSSINTSDAPPESILDIGCSYGWQLNALTGKALTLVGVDMNRTALEEAEVNYPHIRFIHQNASVLPLENESFDVVILSEVIEHVGDENKQLVINEAFRVLKPGGMFILTCPYAGLFAWADPMDFKRRFPGMYGLYMRLTRYTPDTSVDIGHKHLSLKELQNLFADRFKIEHIQYCGLLMPWFTWTLAIDSRVHLLPRRVHEGLNRLRGWESGVSYGKFLSL